MNKRQLISTVTVFFIGGVLSFSYNMQAKEDTWFACILAVIFALLFSFLYAFINKRYPGKDIFEVIDLCFGKVLGKVISCIYILYVLLVAVIALDSHAFFLSITSLLKTPLLVISVSLCTIIVWILCCGEEIIIGRLASILAPVILTAFTIGVFLNIKDVYWGNIMPVLEQDFKTILTSSINIAILPYAEMGLLFSIVSQVQEKKGAHKAYLTGVLVAGIVQVIAVMRNILVLGVPFVQTAYFPSFSCLSVIDIKGFISRIEVITSAVFLFSFVIKMSVIFSVLLRGVKHIKAVKKKSYVLLPVSVVVIIVGKYAFSSITQLREFLPYYTNVTAVFQIAFPLLLLAITLIKSKFSFKPKQAVEK